MTPDEKRKVDDAFASGIRLILLVIVATSLLAGGLAFFLLRFGPILGSTLSIASTIGIVVILGFVFARTVRRIQVRRKSMQRGLRCAYCKDDLVDASVSICPACGSIFHHECLRTFGCATFACSKASAREVIRKT